MAQVIITDQQAISESWTMWIRTVLLGVVTGSIFWLLSMILTRYIVDPLACGRLFNAAICYDSAPFSGNIAAILAALGGLVSMVLIGAVRPIVIASAAAAVLWNLGTWIDGLFWLEAALWSITLYAGAYALFAWITRHANLLMTGLLSVLVVVIIRISLIL
ncbi:MAG: hypothetical protein EOT05_03990 [Candidatus Microsaccharimonas sossegonensis]|uniref:Uncharacterized protein n=1 Tax=Candidatus Microsaccharimonas sossegonensis TaxID=2506948 RepID=A0A4Q0AIP5_9BACT|nr:MAG: hypothetical protein EOT05_03990 [Candidatus Microsaccharimonas sossegonensis]